MLSFDCMHARQVSNLVFSYYLKQNFENHKLYYFIQSLKKVTTQKKLRTEPNLPMNETHDVPQRLRSNGWNSVPYSCEHQGRPPMSNVPNRWFSRDVISAMLVEENKRFLISSFCSSTSYCTLQHCYLFPQRLVANHLLAIIIIVGQDRVQNCGPRNASKIMTPTQPSVWHSWKKTKSSITANIKTMHLQSQVILQYTVYPFPCQSQVDRVTGQWTKYGTLYVPIHYVPT